MKHTWMIAALLGAAACVSPEAHRNLTEENGVLRRQLADMSANLQQLSSSYDQLDARNKDLGARAAETAWIDAKKAEIAELLARYKSGSPSAVSGVELVSTAEGYAFRVAGGVLFSSGQNALSEQGRRTLTELAASLSGRRLRIEGHTDDEKITRSQWGTNLRLSVERSMSVADFLINTAKLPADQVSVAGYGEYRPAVQGTTDQDRSTNRRVEILMLDR